MALLYGNHEHGMKQLRSLFNLFIMNTKSFEQLQLVHEYLTTTDDALSSNVCRAFGLSRANTFFDLRVREEPLILFKMLLETFRGWAIGSSLSAPATLKEGYI
ncbi:hypothetical protein MASR2M78_28740 [Treponema sp.]